MDLAEDPDHEAVAAGVRAVCAEFDDDYWAGCDRDHRFPWEFYDAMVAGGWVGVAIPERFGGGGCGITEAAILMREVAASGAAMNGCTALHLTVFGLEPVVRFGSERLQEAFLPRAAAGDLHVAFGVTEPTAGTDTSRIATRATPDATIGEDGGWRISGQKIWTSKAEESEVCLLLARTGEAEAGLDGLSLFLVDLDPAHVTVRPIPKTARNAVGSCEVFYDELPVEGWRLVGEEGRGFRHLLSGLNPERILIAAEAIGTGLAALRRGIAYAKERQVFGRPIGANQALSHPLADAHARLRAAWLMVQLAAWRYDHGLPCGEEANTAKYLAAEAGFDACDRVLQVHGGLGFAEEYHVGRYWREARIMRVAPVSQEMTLNYLAQQVLGLPRSY
ncbi:acyl-CoA/acyl-ACP dehydrogenase [Iamia sp. SCSIO 61187]|uniref:acyl-CoA dehydrogenase family protein n=1 Tax=Iamia sp. SCSIO 61187 TaxID=2722752 RepID=UPI001C63B445|nr:acyl-CoA dehydrogenase family protein [Iamia sp. SCSIO 61187]QYG93968.1 acyl-CoA/acyl-ACP dehydrogenase [Iamia sp. SCSIO 61187]